MASTVDSAIHEPFVRLAIDLASAAVEHGNHPFGACLVSNDSRQVLLTAENTVNQPQTDVTRHAELNLISMATQKFSRNILEQCTLYTSCEPCMMCTGALYWSGIRHLVYALPHETLRKYAGNDGLFSCRSFLSPSLFSIIGPLIENEAVKVHETFWSRSAS